MRQVQFVRSTGAIAKGWRMARIERIGQYTLQLLLTDKQNSPVWLSASTAPFVAFVAFVHLWHGGMRRV